MKDNGTIKNSLKKDGVGILPTDTLYGLVGRALSRRAVAKIYKLKGRTPTKPLIILIADLNDLKRFKIKLEKEERKYLAKIWPGRVSVVLSCPAAEFKYLHRGTKTLAFRLPRKKALTELIKTTGPLVAPSANPEGLAPAETITQAKKYFGDQADFYSGRGRLAGLASTLIKLKEGQVEILRLGAGKLPKK